MRQPTSSSVAVSAPPALSSASTPGDAARLAAVRRFHVSAGSPGPGVGVLPALLHPFRDPSRVRGPWPVCLSPHAGEAPVPLGELLDRLAPSGDDARVLRDNLLRLERGVRARVTDGPVPARATLEDAGRAMVRALGLDAANASRLEADLAALARAVPEGATLLPYGPDAGLRLLARAAASHVAPARATWRREASQLAGALRELLEVERAKSGEAHSGAAVARSVGMAGAWLDPSALAAVSGRHRGSSRMDPARLERVRGALARLDAALATHDQPAMVLVCSGGPLGLDLEGAVEVGAEDACAEAAARFDAASEALAPALAAMRVARLEAAGRYEPRLHDGWVDHMEWEAFTAEELALLPVVVAVERPARLAGVDMASLARVVGSGRPVQVVVAASPTGSPGASTPVGGFRVELGYLGVALREAFVQQGSACRPAELAAGFAAALRAPRGALHVLSDDRTLDGDEPGLGAWLFASMSVESRGHPLFRYDPGAGTHWAERLDFTGNAQPERDWPVETLAVVEPDGQPAVRPLALTWIDLALLDPALGGHFLHLDDDVPGDDLVEVPAWLELPVDEARLRVPYTWGVDAEGRMLRLAVSRAMAWACRDRLTWWRTLQELAGVNNEYARVAAEQARAEERAAAEAALAAAKAAHAAELDRVRREEAGEAMRRLAAALLDADLAVAPARPSPLAHPPVPAASAAAPAAAAPAAPAAAAPAVEEDDGGFDEAFIDSFLCTTCNECININSAVFAYNGDKQARIVDASQGTFGELVRAAESCPARCIHPGKPLNPAEPGLDDLVKRAAPFNR